MNAIQTRLMRVDQPGHVIATVPTSEFVSSTTARFRVAAPNSLLYAHLPTDHQTAFEVPPTTEAALDDEDQKLRIWEFFRGYSDSWLPIQMGIPVDIDVMLDDQRVSLSTLKGTLESWDGFGFLKIFGPGGSGKTTAARQLAYGLRNADHIVLYRLPNPVSISPDQLRQSARKFKGRYNRRMFLFWDSPHNA